MTDQVFRVSLKPVPWSVVANTKGKSFKPERLKAFQRHLQLLIEPHARTYSGPVKLDLLLVFARGKGRAKQAEKQGLGHEWHTVKPDRDNCLKAVQDALKNIWPDDCCVVDGVTSKIWGSRDLLLIRIGPAEPVHEVVEWFGFQEGDE